MIQKEHRFIWKEAIKEIMTTMNVFLIPLSVVTIWAISTIRIILEQDYPIVTLLTYDTQSIIGHMRTRYPMSPKEKMDLSENPYLGS